jgi:hypothetical protein
MTKHDYSKILERARKIQHEASKITAEYKGKLQTLRDIYKNIPLHQEQQLRDYVQLSKRLLKEIAEASTNLQLLSDESLHDSESDEDFTEPYSDKYYNQYPPDIAKRRCRC